MSHHIGCNVGGPPAATIYADYRQPITNVMRKIGKARQLGKPPSEEDLALVRDWAADHPQDVCTLDPAECRHPPARPDPGFSPPRYVPDVPGQDSLW